MIDYTKRNVGTTSAAVGYDEGLRSYMQNIYNYMALALAFTGAIAYGASTSEAFISALYTLNAAGQPAGISLLGYLIMFAPLGLVMFLSFRINSMSLQTAQITFWAYAAVNGLAFASIFLVYTGASIAKVFFISASLFGAMSLYGYTTKKDLTSIGSFLIMGVWGIFIASIVNLFLGSSGLSFIISILAVIIFTGLTAYDTQRIKEVYFQLGGADVASKKKVAIMGALNLYIDFIMIFINLLRLIGERR